MTEAQLDLYAFVYNAVRGICDNQSRVCIEMVESHPNTVSVVVYVDRFDLRFLYSKIREIKAIAIAIARRHNVIVNLVVGE